MIKNIKLEVLIATPPTSKCEETVEVLREVVRRHPEETSLVVFKKWSLPVRWQAPRVCG